MRRLRVCIYSLTGCEGCALSLVNTVLEREDLYAHFELTGHLIDVDEVRNCDIAFVDGAAVTNHDIELLKEIRERSRILVALGTCAELGGIDALIELVGFEESARLVYVEKPEVPHIGETKPIPSLVKVDYIIPGCPPPRSEIAAFLLSLVHGKTFRLPDSAVCHECRSRGYRCVLKEGRVCLGMVTRAGCGARCIAYGMPCWGCRGPIEDASSEKVLELAYANNIDPDTVRKALAIFMSKTALYRDLAGVR